MYVIGGQGYVGSRLATMAAHEGHDVTVVGRTGPASERRPGIAWPDLEGHIQAAREPQELVWLLDGAKHAEADRLAELLGWATPQTHLVFVSTCTVYGDQHGRLSAESTPVQLVGAHARLKAECEQLLVDAGITWCVLRLGALYGIDDRGVRRDRIEKWVTQAANDGVVTVPEPTHWRGWLHRDQAARALLRAAQTRSTGVLNVASTNMTFADAAGTAAGLFDARVEGDGKPDPCDYQVDATAARYEGLLDEHPDEDLATCARAFAAVRWPSSQRP